MAALDDVLRSLPSSTRGRIRNHLARLGITDITELCRANVFDLGRGGRLGIKSLDDLNAALSAHGLRLGSERSDSPLVRLRRATEIMREALCKMEEILQGEAGWREHDLENI